ncbi:MAG TPA: hypothetical protein VIL36_21005, partial [Acidimicrobiales bacterium]
FYRMRDFWLAGCEAAFRHGGLGLSQFVVARTKPATWPLTRRYMDTDAAVPDAPAVTSVDATAPVGS